MKRTFILPALIACTAVSAVSCVAKEDKKLFSKLYNNSRHGKVTLVGDTAVETGYTILDDVVNTVPGVRALWGTSTSEKKALTSRFDAVRHAVKTGDKSLVNDAAIMPTATSLNRATGSELVSDIEEQVRALRLNSRTSLVKVAGAIAAGVLFRKKINCLARHVPAVRAVAGYINDTTQRFTTVRGIEYSLNSLINEDADMRSLSDSVINLAVGAASSGTIASQTYRYAQKLKATREAIAEVRKNGAKFGIKDADLKARLAKLEATLEREGKIVRFFNPFGALRTATSATTKFVSEKTARFFAPKRSASRFFGSSKVSRAATLVSSAASRVKSVADELILAR